MSALPALSASICTPHYDVSEYKNRLNDGVMGPAVEWGVKMPAFKRDLIGALGLHDRVRDMATKEGLNTHQIAERMNDDPQVAALIAKTGMKTRVYPTDVYTSLCVDLAQKSELLAGSAGSEAETSLIVQSAKERALSVIKMGSEWDAVANKALALLSTELDAYEEVKNMDASTEEGKDARALARFPNAAFDTTRKAVMASLQFAKAFSGDAQVQALVRAQTVNISQGITQDRLHDILFAIGDVLGKDRNEMVTAYTKALVALKRQAHSERNGAVDVPVMPKFTTALEQSSGLAAPAEG